MGQKGFSLIIFVFGLLLISAAIIGGLIALKKYKPDLIPSFTTTQKQEAQAAKNNTSKEDLSYSETVDKVRNMLSCHFNKYGKYPNNFSGDDIDKECVSQYSGSDNITSDNYVVYNNGQSYNMHLTVVRTYRATENGSSLEVPQEKIFESAKRNRDALRLTDLANLQTAINVAIQDAGSSADKILCSGMVAPCFGSSFTGSRVSNGTGWVKINISSQKSVSVPILPIDPVNNERLHYVYCATQTAWEINAVLDSDQLSNRMKTDGGDDDTKYEIGSDLNLIGKVPGCKY